MTRLKTGSEFIGSRPWPRVSKIIASRGPRLAAIAYLGADAPRLLRGLKRGDVLVVNATKEAVAAHATSPHAIAALMQRGVAVSTSPRLHAKVIVTAEYAVIGSANASATSEASHEAVVVTTEQAIMREVHKFVEALAIKATPLDEEDAPRRRVRPVSPAGMGREPAGAGPRRQRRVGRS